MTIPTTDTPLHCPDCDVPVIVKTRPGCHIDNNCTHICPQCGWHYTLVDES